MNNEETPRASSQSPLDDLEEAFRGAENLDTSWVFERLRQVDAAGLRRLLASRSPRLAFLAAGELMKRHADERRVAS